MSSSPPPLVPSSDSCEVRSSSSHPAHDELPASARVSDLLHPTSPRDRPDLASIVPRPSDGANASSDAGLNPLAREFVPNVSASTPDDEEFTVSAPPGELATVSENGRERVSGNFLDGTQTNAAEASESRRSRRLGGLTKAFKDEQAGQGRTGSLSRGGQAFTNNVTYQPITGPPKRGQFTSANHLLNFQYDPIVRQSPSHRPFFRHKLQKAQPFNKELFVQANFRFLVSDFGDHLLNSLDPDKMLHWEDVAALTFTAPVPVQCPICLEAPPLCPQITSCGHMFCFPCILRYFILGNSEQRSDLLKKCPLCFAITSIKELRTVFVDTVRNYQVGDMIELTLLYRLKSSIIPFEKNEGAIGSLPYSKGGLFHPFSKFTLISDVAETTEKAVAELSTWTEGVQKEARVSEDLDMIPFALLAIEHLQQRKSAWDEHRASEFISCSPPMRQRIVAQTKEALGRSLSHSLKVSDAEHINLRNQSVDVASETEAAMADLKDRAGWIYEAAFSDDEEVSKQKARQSMPNNDAHTKVSPASWEDKTYEKANEIKKLSERDKYPQQTFKGDDEDDDRYAFFQCADGQPLIMHPLNMKCILQHYGSYENLPSRIQVKILEMEGQTQTDALRKRYRYLSHLPLTTNFWFCEVDLRGLLPNSAFTPFSEELRLRETRRRRRQKQELAERLREDRVSAIRNRNSPPTVTVPVIKDLKEDEQLPVLGSSESNVDSLISSSEPTDQPEPTDQRKLFSQVTRLGFASAHDAPDLLPTKTGEVSVSGQERAHNLPWSGASRKVSAMSFADIIQAQPSKTSPSATNVADAPSQSTSKRNKKSSKVLLSTAGGRRY